MKKVLLFIAIVGIMFPSIRPVHAQSNVSCNSAYYHNENYIDVKTPASGPAGTKPIINLWGDSGFNLRIIIKRGSTTLATINPNGASGYRKLDTREVNYGDTIRYEVLIRTGSSTVQPRWMPTNVGSHDGTCGTGCPNGSGGYFAVPDVKGLFIQATSNGEIGYDLTTSGTSLFLSGQRTHAVDKAMTCWNDQPEQAGTVDDDFNDWQLVWSLSQTVAPTATPTATPTGTPSVAVLTVQTDPATQVTTSSATLNGNVLTAGSNAIVERGFFYSSTTTTPSSTSGTKTTTTGTLGAMSSGITGLSAQTTYYFVAYAKDSTGAYAYGQVRSFTTSVTSPYHTPGNTGIAEDMMILAGAVLYVVGIISFMGSKVIAKKLGTSVALPH